MTQVDAVRSQRVLVDDEFVPATITIKDGRIDAVAPFDHQSTGTVIEAPCVLPGVVDTHVHVNEPGRTEWEGFVSATLAAALGGVTTLVDMPLNSVPPTTTLEGLRVKQEAALGELAMDVGFWGGAVPGQPARPRTAVGRRRLRLQVLPVAVGCRRVPAAQRRPSSTRRWRRSPGSTR